MRVFSYATAACVTALTFCLVPSVTQAQGFSNADTQLRFDGALVSPSGATARAGFTSTPTPGGGIVPIFVYRLPVIAAGTTITSAVLSVNLAGIGVPGSINYNVDLYALPFRSTSTVVASDFFVGPAGTATTGTLIQDNFVLRSTPTSSTPLGRYETNLPSSAILASFLNAQYSSGAVGGAAGDFVFFRFSPDQTVALGFGGYDFNTQDNVSTSGLRPTLTLTTAAVGANAPEPSSAALLTALPLMLGVYIVRRGRSRLS